MTSERAREIAAKLVDLLIVQYGRERAKAERERCVATLERMNVPINAEWPSLNEGISAIRALPDEPEGA